MHSCVTKLLRTPDATISGTQAQLDILDQKATTTFKAGVLLENVQFRSV